MKKRILSGLCIVLICLSVLTASVTLGAPRNPCFMAVNDTLLPLDDRFIPITIDGQYYVPYSVLDSNATGINLGVFTIYSSIHNTLMIYTRDLALNFDLNKGSCVDRHGNSQSIRAVTRNGRIYVPARFVCEYFGLVYSSRSTAYSPLVRVRNAAATRNDTQFVEQAQTLMAERLSDWRKAQRQDEPSVVTPSPTPTVTVPSPTPTVPEIDKSDVNLYLAFRVDQTAGLESLLARLQYSDISALFFFPASELAEYDEEIRRVLCGGHIVGLTVSGADADEIAQQAAQGNRLLAQIAHVTTYTILPQDEQSAAACEAAKEKGLLCWNTDVDALPDGSLLSERVNRVLKAADAFEEKVFVLSDASVGGAALMTQLLPELFEMQYTLRLAVETEL